MPFSIREILTSAYRDGNLAERSWQDAQKGLSQLSHNQPAIQNDTIQPPLEQFALNQASYDPSPDGKMPTLDKIIGQYHDLLEITDPTVIRSYLEKLHHSKAFQMTSARLVLTSDEILKPAVGIHIYRIDYQRNSQPAFWGSVHEHMDRPPYKLTFSDAMQGQMYPLNPYTVHNTLANQFIMAAVKQGFVYPPTI